jgi:UDP-N-acetylglucosamine--dolichyl-phosphate N-acetylglucosaminephosphotransferase
MSSLSSIISYETLGLIILLIPSLFLFFQIDSIELRAKLINAALVSLASFLTTVLLVPAAAPSFAIKGLKGRDLGRRGTAKELDEVPSALGLISAVVFLAVVIVGMLAHSGSSPADLHDYNAAMLAVGFMVLLGFADDVLDLPWRYKIFLPMVASLPLLLNYHAGGGGTTIIMPKPLRSLLAASDGSGLTVLGSIIERLGIAGIDAIHGARTVDLGFLYLVYMGMLAVFATNAINIYAGINGLEAGQSLVIGIAILFANLQELAQGAEGEHARHHAFSATLALPFIAVTAGLLVHNTHPAKVFVGDTFCYFAGMCFAVMAILGHFSKTLLLLLLPQVFNFIYSIPQLFKVYPCPRHRLPDYDATIDKMRPSGFNLPIQLKTNTDKKAVENVAVEEKDKGVRQKKVGGRTRAGSVVAPIAAVSVSSSTSIPSISIPSARRRTGGASAAAPPSPKQETNLTNAGFQVTQSHTDINTSRRLDNFTLINLMLRWIGPLHERTATNVLLLLQVLSCALTLALRSYLQTQFADQ